MANVYFHRTSRLAAVMKFIVDFSLDISKNHLKALESSGDTASSKDHVDILEDLTSHHSRDCQDQKKDTSLAPIPIGK